MFPFLNAVVNGNEVVKSIIDYANKNNIILRLNEKDNDNSYPLLISAFVNKPEVAKLIANYTNTNNITLIINDNDNRYKRNSISYALTYNNSEMIELLIDYANANDIILVLKEDKVCSISELDIEIIELLYKSYDAYEMNIIFDKENNNKPMIEYHSNYYENLRKKKLGNDLPLR
ncbi:hypothetical protein H8356DRAFT_1077866 [Neocallimastix lanati (nom. inval.)]|uniref:Ankyrin n=1 Tax=Neocallimastix californiae TaxID=1754190 RepID=A0A1Y2BXI3_9FUNG|nr:hypothetical protein H8356DRAFT_1077866 [Neocallimastix sp. JGI-2020a]ORY39463.1 hypothetical protein LY90DRAFT_623477 [Neocallimastix californiae]|eukprot:ORY39463.1 hypothetical protein LY90DRAFT_623477 [Neocallimastix californiae]